MNQTIERIVNLLFEDLQETPEVASVREEVLTNCQERYDDMILQGVSEDEAVHAVVESLKGMEEMLRSFPRKDHAPVGQETAEEISSLQFDPAAQPIHAIRGIDMAATDIRIVSSEDDFIHADFNDRQISLSGRVDNGVLLLSQQKLEQSNVNFSISLDLNDLKGFLGKLFNRISTAFSSSCITLRIPAALQPSVELSCTSGDVSLSGVLLHSLSVATTSGDIELSGVSAKTRVQLTSTSGDAELHGVSADTLQITTTSGDIETARCTVSTLVKLTATSGDIDCISDCPEADVSTISGDVVLHGPFENAAFKTISGDIHATVTDPRLKSLNGKSTSGDIVLKLPQDIHACVSCRTACGDVSLLVPSFPDSSVRVDLNTTAGDIVVR